MKKTNLKPKEIEHAEKYLSGAAERLKAYIMRRISEEGSERNLSRATGIPRTSINNALNHGTVIGLYLLAVRLHKGGK